jgi:hypothetical protein
VRGLLLAAWYMARPLRQQKKNRLFTTKIDQLIPLREIITVYFKNHTNFKNTLAAKGSFVKLKQVLYKGLHKKTGTFEMRSGSHVQLAALRNRDLEDVIFRD